MCERLARRPGLPIQLLADHLANQPLDGLRIDDRSVRDALATDYQAVTDGEPVAAHAYRLLGGLEPGATITPESAADRLGSDASLIFHALERLVDARLVESPEPGHYCTTGLPHAYAAELAATAPAEPAGPTPSEARGMESVIPALGTTRSTQRPTAPKTILYRPSRVPSRGQSQGSTYFLWGSA